MGQRNDAMVRGGGRRRRGAPEDPLAYDRLGATCEGRRVAADQPRGLAEIPLAQHCICAALAEWARPCGACRWRRGEEARR